jgi:DNA-directed RNA polymerase subunit RPC12/RpoP
MRGPMSDPDKCPMCGGKMGRVQSKDLSELYGIAALAHNGQKVHLQARVYVCMNCSNIQSFLIK